MTDFRLTEGEKSHPLWARLKSHLEDRLAASRVQNDGADLSPTDTAALRGRIGCLKSIIRLGDDLPLIDDAPMARRD
jgi:hypothetical protein